MRFGVCVPNYGETVTSEGLRAVAIEAEKLGYDSVWVTDHILMPAGSGTPYERILESLSSLAYLASVTKKVKLGISSLIIAMRNPIVAVKQLATIDVLSNGRVILATSAGWNEHEFKHLGSNFHDRGKRVNDSIRLIRTLWEGKGEFKGKSIPHEFSDAVFEPRPVQNRLSIWIGGASKAAMRRAIRLGDAWHPNVYPLDKFKQLVREFREIPGGNGKDICVRMGLNIKAPQSEYIGPQGDRRILLSGNIEQNRSIVSELEKLGVSYMVLATNPNGKVSTAEQVESLQIFTERVVASS